MTDALPTSDAADHVLSPSLAPSDFVGILQDADVLLSLMGSEALSVVASLAKILSVSANGAGARDIADAAGAVSRIASGHQPVALAGAMRDLTAAIFRAQHEFRLVA